MIFGKSRCFSTLIFVIIWIVSSWVIEHESMTSLEKEEKEVWSRGIIISFDVSLTRAKNRKIDYKNTHMRRKREREGERERGGILIFIYHRARQSFFSLTTLYTIHRLLSLLRLYRDWSVSPLAFLSFFLSVTVALWTRLVRLQVEGNSLWKSKDKYRIEI